MKECLSEEILQQYFDGELGGVRLGKAASHLAGCEACAANLQELETETNFVAAALAAEFEVAVPTEHLQRRIEAAIAGQHRAKHVATPTGRNLLATLSAMFSLSPQRSLAYGSLVAVVMFAAILGMIKWRTVDPVVVPETQVAVNKENVPPPSTPQVVSAPAPAGSGPTLTGAIPRPARKKPTTAPQPVSDPPSVAKVKLLPGERSYLKSIAALDSTIKSGSTTMRPALQAEYERNLALVDRAIAATRSAAKRNPNDPDTADFMFAAYQSKVDLLNTIADARVYNRPR